MKTAGLSKRGMQSQSTDPWRLTSAAEEQSDRSPYSAIARLGEGSASHLPDRIFDVMTVPADDLSP